MWGFHLVERERERGWEVAAGLATIKIKIKRFCNYFFDVALFH